MGLTGTQVRATRAGHETLGQRHPIGIGAQLAPDPIALAAHVHGTAATA